MTHVVKVETKPGPRSGDKPRHRWACSSCPRRGDWTTDYGRAQGGGSKHVTYQHSIAPVPQPADIAVEEHW